MNQISKADFTINNDEIDKVSKTIHKLKDYLVSIDNIEEVSHVQNEILCLLEINKILYKANVVYDPSEYIVIDQMRIKKSDYDEFFSLLSRVKIEGLDVVKPLREGDFLPGTKNKIKVPREIKEDESIPEYEDYLYDFYQKYGYNLPPREYVDGTEVYKVREPYIHELYTLKATEDGYCVGRQYASRNPYYRRMKRYYEDAAKKALEIKKSVSNNDLEYPKIFQGAYVSQLPKKPIKVLEVLQVPLNFFRKRKNLENHSEVPTTSIISKDRLQTALVSNKTFDLGRKKIISSVPYKIKFNQAQKELIRNKSIEFLYEFNTKAEANNDTNKNENLIDKYSKILDNYFPKDNSKLEENSDLMESFIPFHR